MAKSNGGIPGAMQINEDERMADHLVTAKKDGYQRWERSPEGQDATRRREQIEQSINAKVEDKFAAYEKRIASLERIIGSLTFLLEGEAKLVVTGDSNKNIEWDAASGRFVPEGDYS